jgi:hypothetical protein
MLSPQPSSQRPQRLSIYTNSFVQLSELYTDARLHGHQGLTRTVRLPGAAASGGGAIAKSEDGERCVVAGKECVCSSMMVSTCTICIQPITLHTPIALRILRISDTQTSLNPDHKSAVGRGGHRIDASRNLWTGSGLKMESISTDVAWGRGSKSQT